MKVVGLYKLCPPAKLYLIVSVLILLIMLYQNTSHNDIFCLGIYNCNIKDKSYLFFINAIYVVFWTWLLNIICSNGYTMLSWFLVFIPPIMFLFLTISMFRFV